MDMIKKLQLKFIITVVLILTLVFSVIICAVNISTIKSVQRQNKAFLISLVESDGIRYINRREIYQSPKDYELPKSEKEFPLPEELLREKKNQTFEVQNIRNFFSVKLKPTGKISEIISQFPINYTEEEITKLTTHVFENGREYGIYSGITYLVAERPYGYIICFLETRFENTYQSMLLRVSLSIYGISLVFSIIFAWLFSIWAIKPVRITFKKQKQFVADASHELKTPLAVISANMDVLTSEIGENKWTEYIKNEIQIMSSLVKDLLYLAKSDSNESVYKFLPFDISRTVMSAILPFESSFFDQGKVLNMDIQPGLIYNGDENRIKQVIIILIDNALKHTDSGATITVSLNSIGSKKVLAVRNTGDGIPPLELSHIFERFYRIDSSRNRETGGFGLGLAIAKAITDAHHGKLTASSVVGQYTEFTLTL